MRGFEQRVDVSAERQVLKDVGFEREPDRWTYVEVIVDIPGQEVRLTIVNYMNLGRASVPFEAATYRWPNRC